jgi:hypothetical protein
LTQVDATACAASLLRWTAMRWFAHARTVEYTQSLPRPPEVDLGHAEADVVAVLCAVGVGGVSAADVCIVRERRRERRE